MKIINCSLKYQCTNKWENLDTTNQPKVRYCRECDRGVHQCDDETEYQQAIKLKRCVALNKPSNDDSDYVLGLPGIPVLAID